MEEQLKKRWKWVLGEIYKCPLKREYIRKEIGVSKTTMSCYTQAFRGKAVYPAYITESMTRRFEEFFSLRLVRSGNKVAKSGSDIKVKKQVP